MDESGLQFENEKEWRQYLIGRLDSLHTKVDKNTVEIAKLVTKASIWGAFAGLVVAGILGLFGWFKG